MRQGVPVEVTFDRQESGDCTSRVVFPDLRVSAALPAYQHTTVRLDPGEAGKFGFACGMNMIHGTLIVAPATGGPAADSAADGGKPGPRRQAPPPPRQPAARCPGRQAAKQRRMWRPRSGKRRSGIWPSG